MRDKGRTPAAIPRLRCGGHFVAVAVTENARGWKNPLSRCMGRHLPDMACTNRGVLSEDEVTPCRYLVDMFSKLTSYQPHLVREIVDPRRTTSRR